jgi:hypothetical protein
VTALKQLAGNSGYHFQLLNSVIEVNELQKRRVMAKLEKHLGSLVGKEIALLGLAFKPNTDDMREASSLVLSARLQAAGARVRAYDPVAEEEARKLIPRGVDFKASALEAGEGADAIVLVTEWPEFAELDLGELATAMRGTLVIDGRNFLDAAKVRDAGLFYEGVGRPAPQGPRAGPHRVVQALILAGGEGTRLRPLTTTYPKPVVPLVDRPFIGFMLDWLRSHGVDEVIMGCGHMADGVQAVLGDGSGFGIKLSFLVEPRPLGHRRRPEVRRGQARRAFPDAQRRRADGPRPDRPDRPARGDGRARHARADAGRGPLGYGLVRLTGEGAVTEFVEKPSADQIDTNNISAAPTCSSARCSSCWSPASPPRSSATCSRGWSATASTATSARATGWTSGRPSATCRGPSTSSRARSRPRSRRAWARASRASPRRRDAGPDHPVGAGRARLPDRARRRGSAGASCSSAA